LNRLHAARVAATPQRSPKPMPADLFEDHRVIVATAEELLAAARRRRPPAGPEELSEIRARYSDHVRKWTPRAVQADREGYAQALVDMLACLKPVIAQEERDLYWPALRLLRERSGLGRKDARES
jgi:hypothetical protein